MRGIAIRVGIIAAIAIGAFALRPFISGNAGDLAVGDCFDPPAGATGEVQDVQHHPCTEAHGGEVIFVGKLPDGPTMPDALGRQQWVQDNCVPAYRTYTGTDVLTSTDWQIAWFRPTDDGWTKGDRTITCYAVRLDETKTTGSLKKAS